MGGMIRVSPPPLKISLMVVAVLLVLELIVFVWGNHRRSVGNQQIAQVQNRYRSVSSRSVSLSSETLSNLEDLNSALSVSINRLQDKLFAENDILLKGYPGDPTATYFVLADFVERMEFGFSDSGVEIEEGERFGFYQFKEMGPLPEIIHEVILQQQAMERVLVVLAESRPIRFVGCRRHFVESAVAENAGSVLQKAIRASSDSSKYFDTFKKVNEESFYKSSEVEVSFEGYTESLRVFLTGLESSSIPVLVEELTVSPVEEFDLSHDIGNLSDGSSLVVTGSPSLFKLRFSVWSYGKEPES